MVKYWNQHTFRKMVLVGGLTALFSAGLWGCDDDSTTPEGPGFVTQEINVLSSQYLNHRFFRLDLPESPHYPIHDNPGRNQTSSYIYPASIRVFRMLGPGDLGPGDIPNVAGYVDTTGCFWTLPGCPTPDFSTPYIYGARWREVNIDVMLDQDSHLVAIDLGLSAFAEDYLGATYQVVDASGNLEYKVGDRPGADDEDRIFLPGEMDPYYRMKLIKVDEQQREELLFHHILRNIYSLGGANIATDHFDLKIVQNTGEENEPDHDEAGIPYIRIFGLDQVDTDYLPNPDGVVDWENQLLFDLNRGLLHFPLSFPHPFAAGETAYEDYANDITFEWDGTYLQNHQAPALYSVDELSTNYHNHAFFRLVVTLGFLEE